MAKETKNFKASHLIMAKETTNFKASHHG
ncbi:uncharacterized protein G2W53_004267 [Senna tora]|uniref:Uncharacterized protein n=1 Tax=Senna tora TaxID=362788 RepID=A0A834XCV6_9FABA|nr:uncharacterized protein G2W53_004267 [Senna tora]